MREGGGRERGGSGGSGGRGGRGGRGGVRERERKSGRGGEKREHEKLDLHVHHERNSMYSHV